MISAGGRLDSIDGTVNSSHGLPTFAVSLALLDADGTALAIIHAARLGERHFATGGQGAHLNGSRISRSASDALRECVVCLDDYAPGANFIPERVATHSTPVPEVMRICTAGSAASDLAWITDSRASGCYSDAE